MTGVRALGGDEACYTEASIESNEGMCHTKSHDRSSRSKVQHLEGLQGMASTIQYLTYCGEEG
jgi:hypothetical protein